MLIRIDVENFAPFVREGTLDLEAVDFDVSALSAHKIVTKDSFLQVCPTAFIFGPNNSGKTRYLKLLEGLKDYFLTEDATPKEPKFKDAEKVTKVSLIFWQNNNLYRLKVLSEGSVTNWRLGLMKVSKYRRYGASSPTYWMDDVQADESDTRFKDICDLFRNMHFIWEDEDAKPNDAVKEIYSDKKYNIEQYHLDTTLKVMDDTVNQIKTKNDELFIYHGSRGRRWVKKLKNENKSTIWFLNLMATFLLAKEHESVIFVDNISQHTHALVIEKYIQLFYKAIDAGRKIQLVATTNDVNIMDSPNIRLDSIWMIDCLGDSNCLVAVVEYNGYDKYPEKLSRSYLIGRFGFTIPEVYSEFDVF